jgi:pimeloyl-ACP methyl ester carboxylesterase
MRTILYVLGGVAGLFLVVTSAIMGPYYLEVQHFPADSSAGYFADFYLYVSPAARDAVESGKPVAILVQPNNSGTNSDDPGIHRKDAWWTGFERKSIADELGVVLLVPAFIRPGGDWRIYTHALDREVLTTRRRDLARLDLQLIAMIEYARAELGREGILTDEKILLQGFSASGMFANRFAALHPRRVRAVTVGSPGGWPIAPLSTWNDQRLVYPIGVADLEELTGIPFDSVAYRAVPQLIYMGSLDDNDSVDFRDGWDEEPAALIDQLFGTDPLSRWEVSRSLYERSGANARFLLVEGVGHDRKQLQDSSTQFFAGLQRQ